jgi:hypothetical protein
MGIEYRSNIHQKVRKHQGFKEQYNFRHRGREIEGGLEKVGYTLITSIAVISEGRSPSLFGLRCTAVYIL